MNLLDLYSKDACPVCGQTPCNCTHINEEKVRLDPRCWKGKKIGNPKTKVKGGVRVNNCVPAESVAEGMDDTVAFEIDSENAYNHVMKRFGSVIDWDGDAMVVPRRYWPAVQEVAHDAGGAATEYGTEGVAEAKADPTSTWVVYDGDKVKRFKTHQGAKAYAEQHGGKVASSAHYADKIQGKQGVEESKLYVKRLTSEQSLVEHAKLFSKNLKSDNVPRTALNHYSVVCSTIFARNKKSITESKHITDGNQVIQLIKRLDQFSQLPIKVGAKVAIINSQFQGDSIELWGFTTPKTISKIYKDPSNGSIKQLEFNNDPDDVWPRTENAEYNGQFLMYSAFFGDKKSAEHALTMITLQGSGDLNIRNHITEQGVSEGVNDYLWHGSREEHDVLYPRQANDTGGKEESNKNAVYATPNAKVAIAMGLTTPGSDTGMFPNDPQMVLFKGNIRKGQMVYLHKVPKDLFIKHNSREWYSKPGVEEVKPIEVVKVPVDKYLNLIRQATPQDLELRKKYMKQGVAETAKEVDYGSEYQTMVKRVSNLAKQGPLKTVWDPKKRVYKNVAVDQSKKTNEDHDSGEYSDEAGMAHGNLITIAKAARGLLDTIDQHEDLPEWVQEKIAKVEGMLVSAWNYLQSQEAQGIDPRITEVYHTLAEAYSHVRNRIELTEEFDIIERVVEGLAVHNGVDEEMIWEDLESLTDDELYVFAVTTPIMEDWQKVNKQDKTDGMSRKAVKAYRREHPGSKLKTAVTTKPSKLKRGSKASKRRKSYCSRSRGQMKMHNISCSKTPDKAICKARRRWNCESVDFNAQGIVSEQTGASKLLKVDDKQGVITITVQAPDGTPKTFSDKNPSMVQRWLDKYGIRLPRNITDKFVYEQDVDEISLGDYARKAKMSAAQAKMSAAFGTDPEKRAQAQATAARRERGLARAEPRLQKAQQAAAAQQQTDQEQRLRDKYAGVDIAAEIARLTPAMQQAYNTYQFGGRNVYQQARDQYQALQSKIGELQAAKKLLGEGHESNEIVAMTRKLTSNQ